MRRRKQLAIVLQLANRANAEAQQWGSGTVPPQRLHQPEHRVSTELAVTIDYCSKQQCHYHKCICAGLTKISFSTPFQNKVSFSQPILDNSLAVVTEKLSWATNQLHQVSPFEEIKKCNDQSTLGGGRCSGLSSGSSCQRTDPNSSSASPCSIAFGVCRSVHVKEGWVKVKSIGESSQ